MENVPGRGDRRCPQVMPTDWHAAQASPRTGHARPRLTDCLSLTKVNPSVYIVNLPIHNKQTFKDERRISFVKSSTWADCVAVDKKLDFKV
jgi:hypothetical protein